MPRFDWSPPIILYIYMGLEFGLRTLTAHTGRVGNLFHYLTLGWRGSVTEFESANEDYVNEIINSLMLRLK